MTTSLLKPIVNGEDITIKITITDSTTLCEDNYTLRRRWVYREFGLSLPKIGLLCYVFRKQSQLWLVAPIGGRIDIIGREDKTFIIIECNLQPKKYMDRVFTISSCGLIPVSDMIQRYELYLSIINECSFTILHKLYTMPLKEKFFRNWIKLITGDKMIGRFIENMNCLGLHDIKFIY